MMDTPYILAFTTGFLGGFGHCIGMCGPVVASFTMGLTKKETPLFYLPHILYNTGRLTTYVFIGSLMGITGSFLNMAGRLAGIQEAVALFAGMMMVLMGLGISGLLKTVSLIECHNRGVFRSAAMVLEGNSLWRYFPLGLILGFLPCGLSYSIFFAAAAAGGLLPGMLTALCFGLGTVPALLLFGIILTHISLRVRGLIYRTGGVVVTLMGIYYLWRGLRFYACL